MMRFENVFIESIASCLPGNIVSSADIENRLGPIYENLKLPAGRLELMTGIKERRFWDKGTFPSEASAMAGEKALQKAGLDRKEIGCLINASVCRDFLEPATASVVHHKLGLPQNVLLYDVSNACLGVLNGMVQVATMIELGQIRAGLVVAGENGGPLVDNTIENLLARPNTTRAEIKKAFASLTIGSAAVGVLLAHKDLATTTHKLLGGASMVETRFNELCQGSQDRGVHTESAPLMETDSETMMKEGCALAQKTWAATKKTLAWQNSDVDRIVTHQVGTMHRKLLFNMLELDPAKDFPSLEFLGNTGAASLPTTLALAQDEGALNSADKIALLGIGSGLVCLMLGVEW